MEIMENKEKIQSQLDRKVKKIAEFEKDIAFYEGVGARKDLSWYKERLGELKLEVDQYQKIIDGNYIQPTDLKVLVTQHKGKVIIETLNPEFIDSEFTPNGDGVIGCAVSNNSRVGISKEAITIIKTLRKVGDVIGDLMDEKNEFSWIGGSTRTLDDNSVVCRYFQMPEGFVTIENNISDKALTSIEDDKEDDVEYDNFKQEVWIDIQRKAEWENINGKDELVSKGLRLYERGCRFVGGRIYDNDYKVLNAPEGMLQQREEGFKVMMYSEDVRKIEDLICDIFGHRPYSEKLIPTEEILSYLNPLFDLGFDNPIMNPDMEHWRLSLKATPKEMIEKLKLFKREEFKIG